MCSQPEEANLWWPQEKLKEAGTRLEGGNNLLPLCTEQEREPGYVTVNEIFTSLTLAHKSYYTCLGCGPACAPLLLSSGLT